MFDYTYAVKSSDGTEWGLFKTKPCAQLMCSALEIKFGDMDDFYVEEIK